MNNFSEPKTITKEEIANMEPVSFPGQIQIVTTEQEAAEAVEFLNKLRYIGFDTETKPAFKKGQVNKVALLQLSGSDRCYLFRLNKLGFPDCLINLLKDPHILKIGLSIRDDYATMHRLANFEPKGFIELQNFVKNYNIQEASLQKIYAILFGRKISKNQRLTNWEAESLTDGQKKYAATDAWACLRIYESLNDII